MEPFDPGLIPYLYLGALFMPLAFVYLQYRGRTPPQADSADAAGSAR